MQFSESLQQLKGKNPKQKPKKQLPTKKIKRKKKEKKQNSAYLLNLFSEEFP